MKRTSLLPRLTALLLCLAMLVSPALALTPDQARDLLTKYYVDPVPQEVLDQTTVADMLRVLDDPYTEYLSPQEYQAFLSSMSDPSTGGIGVVTTTQEDGLLVTEVYENSPAQAAGIQPGDLLVAVEGQNIADIGADRAVELIRGEVGTAVRIAYLRGRSRREITLTRNVITLPATTGSILEGCVGYIDCDTWGEDTYGYFEDLIRSMDAQVGCWLVDLRGNTGGLTQAATDAAGLFCGPGTMLSLRMRDSVGEASEDGYAYEFYTAQAPALTHKPVVILTDGLTASASEAFTAALRDYDRAVIVGGRTYGKGVAQGLWDKDNDPALFPDGDCLKITIARSYSPLGDTNNIMGIIPHLPTMDEDAADIALSLAMTLAEEEDWQSFVSELLTGLVNECRFDDTADSPYEGSITALAGYELVNGKGDGLFHPDDVLTRAELAQILANVLDAASRQPAGGFTDVDKSAWYASAAAAMRSLRLMEGTAPGVFSPDRVLTRQELFTVLGRLGRWLNDDLDLLVRRSTAEDYDLRVLEGYDDWAKSSVWLLSCALETDRGHQVNLLWDEPENIDPTAPATRGETADAVYSLLYYLNILP